MTRRNVDDLTNRKSPSVDPDTIMSPPPPQASPAARSPMNGGTQDAPSPPTMLATMTPVNVLELKKDMSDIRRHSDDHPVYEVKTEMIYSEKDEQDLYHMSEKHHAPIDLIYEDGSKTVIYTTTPDQKGLEIYSSQNDGEITINNINTHPQLHAHLTDVLMDGESSSMVGSGHCEEGESGNPPGTVSVVLQGGGQGLLQYSQAQVPATTVLVLSELVGEDMSTVPVLGLR